MKDNTKTFLKDAFGSLISNDKAISAAKTSPWWLTIVLFFVAIILPIVPLTVNSARSYGSSFLKTYDYGFRKTMPKIALEMAKDNKVLTVNNDHELGITVDDDTPSYKYVNEVTNRTEMEIYFSAANTSKAKSAFITYIADHKLELEPASGDKEATYYHPSYFIFFNNGIYTCLFAPDSTSQIAYSSFGDFKSIEPGTDLVKMLTQDGDGYYAPASESEITDIIASDASNNALYKNWRTLLDKSYLTTRTRSTWTGSAIYLGVYAGLSLLMSLLVWLLTRGRNNPFNYLTLLVCFRIGTWASVCPGLIGLVLGFLIPNYAVMFFIMALGMRIMWLSMKQLRPQTY